MFAKKICPKNGKLYIFEKPLTMPFQICNFLADSKSRAQELSSDVSFVIFEHQTWDLEGGGQIDPPPAYPGFQVPQQRLKLESLYKSKIL